jgi:hypothetical protein
MGPLARELLDVEIGLRPPGAASDGSSRMLSRARRATRRLSGYILLGFVSLSVHGSVIARSLEARHVAG